MADLVITNKQYIYLKIPTKYICIYHQLCELMVDFGEDMLKDCKASCTDRNSGVIECFNMFNSAVAARKSGEFHMQVDASSLRFLVKSFPQLYSM